MATRLAKIVPKIELPQPLLVKVTYTRCATHSGIKKNATLKALGLRHLNQSIIHKNIRPVRGMISAVRSPSRMAFTTQKLQNLTRTSISLLLPQVKEFISVQPIDVVPE